MFEIMCFIFTTFVEVFVLPMSFNSGGVAFSGRVFALGMVYFTRIRAKIDKFSFDGPGSWLYNLCRCKSELIFTSPSSHVVLF